MRPLLMLGHRMRSEQEHGGARSLCVSIREIDAFLSLEDSTESAMMLDVAEEVWICSSWLRSLISRRRA